MRLKRLITSNPSEPAVDMPYPSRNQKLPRRLCLPVMKGLLAVLLSSQGACSVDFFVLICKVWDLNLYLTILYRCCKGKYQGPLFRSGVALTLD